MPLLRSRKAHVTQSVLETYFSEINETPLLNAKEEKELAYRIEDGDSEARDHMVRANLRLVVNIARGYTGAGLGMEDLVAEGNLGLLRATEGFDPSMNTRFSTYASYWIKQSIKRALVNTAKTIRVPSYMVELFSKWRRATAGLQEEFRRAPTQDEVADRLKLPKRRLANLKNAIRVSSAAPQADQADSGWSLDELVANGRTKRPEAGMEDADNQHQVLDLLAHMESRDAAVLRMRFGLGDEEPKTLREIGECLGLTRERVRQIERDALGKIREGFEPT